MPNKELTCIKINSEAIKKAARANDISIKQLANEVGLSVSRLRHYFEIGKIPPVFLSKICTVAGIAPSSAILGKTIWVRMGVTIPVTDEELNDILKEGLFFGYKRFMLKDVDLSYEIASMFMQRAVVDGESYIPSYCLENHQEAINKLLDETYAQGCDD